MKSICIYCGREKPKAHQICGSCFTIPESHEDLIYSIVMCYSHDEPHLNFLSVEEFEALQDKIKKGEKIRISQEVFNQAEEAYSAVRSVDSPQLIHTFSKYGNTVWIIVLLLTLIAIWSTIA